jgi:hypothetical protein
VAHEPGTHAELDVAGGEVRCPAKIGSTLSIVLPDDSTLLSPLPGTILFELRKARQSVPPVKSQDPLVEDQVNSGMASGGNEVTPACATHPAVQLAVRLWPTVSAPELEM